MKKVVIFICAFFLNFSLVSASEKIEVTLQKCVDGDTAKFNLKDEIITVRFLAIDTPESVHPTKGVEPYGKQASDFTCEKLETAKKIEIEYDEGSDKTDKYQRHLAWVFVDDYLLQDLIIKQGLAEVAYLYGDYKYTSLLQEHETLAKVAKIGIWSDEIPDTEETTTTPVNQTEENKPWYYTAFITIVAVIILFKKNKII